MGSSGCSSVRAVASRVSRSLKYLPSVAALVRTCAQQGSGTCSHARLTVKAPSKTESLVECASRCWSGLAYLKGGGFQLESECLALQILGCKVCSQLLSQLLQLQAYMVPQLVRGSEHQPPHCYQTLQAGT